MTDADMEMREDLYEEAFARMKKAAGVSDIDEVVRRFETQEETTNHLLELQVSNTLLICLFCLYCQFFICGQLCRFGRLGQFDRFQFI